MDFKITKIPPEGRNKYGNYTSASRTSKIITTYVNGGNGTTTTDDYVDNGEKPTPKKNCTIALSSSDGTFKWSTIVSDTKDSAVINVVGYGEIEKVPIYIGDISKEPTSTTDIPQYRNWDIRGIPSNGLTLNVEGNGTLDAKINIVIDENISNEKGTLHIPCSVYVGADEKAPYAPTLTESGTYVDNAGTYEDYVEWVNASGDCKTMWLEYNYVIVVDAVDSYILDLDNEIAAISCNADGSFMAGIEMPTCRATLYYGSSVADGVSYYITYPSHQNVKGLSIDPNTGILTFSSSFSFDGIRLEIKVSAVHNGNTFSKIMTINRLYAGQNGSTGADAVNRWIVPSVNAITSNPNTNSLSVSSITAKVMKREGAKEIVEDTSTQIYWGWDTKTPTTAYTGAITVQSGKGYICFALKNGSTIYEIETVPIVREGQKGEKGDKGDSAYNLVLTNNNASINCDSNGNILSGAVKPACSAYLYYGNSVVNNATYTISTTATGVSLNGNSLSYGSNFSFSGDSVNITFNAYIGSSLILSSIMTITKVKMVLMVQMVRMVLMEKMVLMVQMVLTEKMVLTAQMVLTEKMEKMVPME